MRRSTALAGDAIITDVAAMHAEPPDIRDEDAVLDALRVVLHEQPDIHEKVSQ